MIKSGGVVQNRSAETSKVKKHLLVKTWHTFFQSILGRFIFLPAVIFLRRQNIIGSSLFCWLPFGLIDLEVCVWKLHHSLAQTGVNAPTLSFQRLDIIPQWKDDWLTDEEARRLRRLWALTIFPSADWSVKFVQFGCRPLFCQSSLKDVSILIRMSSEICVCTAECVSNRYRYQCLQNGFLWGISRAVMICWRCRRKSRTVDSLHRTCLVDNFWPVFFFFTPWSETSHFIRISAEICTCPV